jgi:hypothetical protein
MEKNATPASGEERNAGLPGDGSSQQRLPCARRSHQQDPLGQASPEPTVALGLAQEADDLLQLLLRLGESGHVLEADLDVLFDVDLGLALAHGHDAAAEPSAPAESAL